MERWRLAVIVAEVRKTTVSDAMDLLNYEWSGVKILRSAQTKADVIRFFDVLSNQRDGAMTINDLYF